MARSFALSNGEVSPRETPPVCPGRFQPPLLAHDGCRSDTERTFEADNRLSDDRLDREILVKPNRAVVLNPERVEEVVDDAWIGNLPEAVEVPKPSSGLSHHAQLVVERRD